MAAKKTTTPKEDPKAATLETARRSAFVTIGTREVELVLTTRATKLIAARYSGLEHLGKTLGEAVWLITLLANQ